MAVASFLASGDSLPFSRFRRKRAMPSSWSCRLVSGVLSSCEAIDMKSSRILTASARSPREALGIALGGANAQERAQRRRQLARFEGLHEVAVGARFEAL